MASLKKAAGMERGKERSYEFVVFKESHHYVTSAYSKLVLFKGLQLREEYQVNTVPGRTSSAPVPLRTWIRVVLRF